MTNWFAVELDPTEAPLDAAESTFLDTLRAHAAGWPTGGVSSMAFRSDDDGTLIATASLIHASGMLVFGVHFGDGTIRGDVLHNQLYRLPDEPTTLTMRATGTPAELADAAAGWFETIVRRPVERMEWWHKELPYAVRYQFADTREGLSEAYNRRAAPRNQYEKLIAAGSFRGKGWIKTAGIGKPTHIVPVRVDGRQLPTYRLPDHTWYVCPLEMP